MPDGTITTGQGMDESKKVQIIIDNDIDTTAEILKTLAKKGILQKYPATGNAINFLLFGGFGIPGMIDNTILVTEALKGNEKNIGEKFTQEMATNLAMNLAGLALSKTFEKLGITVLERLENPFIFLDILLSSETLGDGTLPKELHWANPIYRVPKVSALDNAFDNIKGSEEKKKGGAANKGGDPAIQKDGGGGVVVFPWGVGKGGGGETGGGGHGGDDAGTGHGVSVGESGGGMGGTGGGHGGGNPIEFEPIEITGRTGNGGSGKFHTKPEDPK